MSSPKTRQDWNTHCTYAHITLLRSLGRVHAKGFDAGTSHESHEGMCTRFAIISRATFSPTHCGKLKMLCAKDLMHVGANRVFARDGSALQTPCSVGQSKDAM